MRSSKKVKLVRLRGLISHPPQDASGVKMPGRRISTHKLEEAISLLRGQLTESCSELPSMLASGARLEGFDDKFSDHYNDKFSGQQNDNFVEHVSEVPEMHYVVSQEHKKSS